MIKLFEEFNKRMPIEITSRQYVDKILLIGFEDLTQKEINELKSVCTTYTGSSIDGPSMEIDIKNNSIRITKLKDNWFVLDIYNHIKDHYYILCDESEELFNYLNMLKYGKSS